MDKKRCAWVKLSDLLYVEYHDNEWGKPLHDDKALFELFSLETQAAGLSWLTILKKREGYREAFENFDLLKVAAFDEEKIQNILQTSLVIKSEPKLKAIVHNAKLFLEILKEYGSIANYFWSKVEGQSIINSVDDSHPALCSSALSDALTKELKSRGFKFIGSVTLYSFLQAAGMIDDHANSCFCKTTS